MIIHAISDLHGDQPELPGGDLLIIAGDCTGNDLPIQWQIFGEYINEAKYRQKIIVAGNHDGQCQNDRYWCEGFIPDCQYLQDEAFEWEGLKIYGSPWTPNFCNWYFMAPRGKSLQKIWEKIPRDLDILITHGPPMGILDGVKTAWDYNRTGCHDLMEAVMVKKPKAHVFGHIHEHGGKSMKTENTTFYNVACMNEEYDVVRGVTEIKL